MSQTPLQRRKHAALEAALEGHMREHQCFLLSMHLRNLKAIDQDLEALDARIGTQLEPHQAQHQLPTQIPGVDWVTAASIIAKIGTDMDVFASARRLAAWAGVAPGNEPHRCARSQTFYGGDQPP